MANAYYKNGSSWINMANVFYPVGAYYLANVSTSPSSLFGGTWQQITDARFLCAYSSAGGNGGENSHVLTVAEMPSHTHGIWYSVSSSPQTKTAVFNIGAWNGKGYGGRYMDAEGRSAAHNNMPLYRTCYCWYRTA